jgi:sugar/nucleoside kinase (ribokinase family)
VAVQLDGERTFHFSRQTSADLQFGPEDVAAQAIQASRIFHFGSNLLVQDRGAGATAWAREVAREAGCLLSYDPNIRLHLWEGRRDLALARARACLPGAHLVKVSDEENALLAPHLAPREAFDQVYRPFGTIALCLTHGARGSTVVTEQLEVHAPGVAVDVIDTTGAGDGFMAGLLSGLCAVLESGGPEAAWVAHLPAIDEVTWRRLLARGNTAGACVCTQLGASASLPTTSQLPAWESES